MNYKILISGIIGIVSAGSASALQLTVESGGLKTQIQQVLSNTDGKLKLTGTANVTDLVLLRQLPDSYTGLDLSGLIIEAYEYTDGNYMGRHKFAAGEMPPFMLFGLNITDFQYPKNVTIIGEGCFANTKFTALSLPSTVTEVGDYAFSRMPNLTSATFGGAINFGKGAFRYCPKLSQVNVGGSISRISDAMFEGCTNLKGILPGASIIGDNAYKATNIQSIDLSGVTQVGDYAFAQNTKLKEITIDTAGQISFGTGAFFGDTSLEDLPEWITSGAPLVTAHSSVKGSITITSPEIGLGAYANAGEITNIKFSPEVANIKEHAFRNLTNLSTVDASGMGDKMPEVSTKSFSGLEDMDGRYPVLLKVNEQYKDQWKAHPVWSLFNINAVASNVNISVMEDVKATRFGNTVNVASPDPITLVEIFNLTGVKLYEGGNETMKVTTEVQDPGVLLVRVYVGDKVKIFKLR